MDILVLNIYFNLKLKRGLFLERHFLGADVFQNYYVVLLELVKVEILGRVQTDPSIVEGHSL